MKVRVRLFAVLRERAGWGDREVELPEGAAVGDVWSALALGEEPAGLLFAVNRSYAAAMESLAAGDEVAVIPPVSGGAFRLSGEPLSLDASLGDALSAMTARRADRLPICDGEGRRVGVIVLADLVR